MRPKILHFFLWMSLLLTVLTMGERTYANEFRKKTITTGGSTTLKALFKDFGFHFEAVNHQLKVQHQASTSGQGIKDLLNEKIDIARSSRPLSIKDRELAKKKGKVIVQIPVAYDALLFVSSKLDCKIKHIDLRDLSNLFMNCDSDEGYVFLDPSLKNKIPYAMDFHTSGTARTFRKFIAQNNSKCHAKGWSAKTQRTVKSEEVAVLLGEDKKGIAFLSSGFVDDTFKKYALKIDNNILEPTESNIVSKKYPFSRALFLVVEYPIREKVVDFVEFITSESANGIIRRNGLYPIVN